MSKLNTTTAQDNKLLTLSEFGTKRGVHDLAKQHTHTHTHTHTRAVRAQITEQSDKHSHEKQLVHADTTCRQNAKNTRGCVPCNHVCHDGCVPRQTTA